MTGKNGTPAGPRTPPQSIEAEESVLGGIMLDNESVNSAIELMRPEDFYRAAHREIFSAMIKLCERREPIDLITLGDQLKKMGCFEECGGTAYLTKLATEVPSSANVSYYAKVVREMSLRRRVIHEASTIIDGALSAEGELEEFLDGAEQKFMSLSEYRIQPSFHRLSDIVPESIRIVEELYDKKESVTGVSSGFQDLDKLTAGFQSSDLIILAARPSMGKTTLALNIAQNVGIQGGKRVALFSLEMSKEQLVLRMLCSEGKVDHSKVRTGDLGDRDFPQLVQAAGQLADAPVYIDDSPALSVTELRAKTRRLHREEPLSLVIVDYLQLLRSPAYSSSREQEISDISRSLKALAKELNVPVIALSQLNRSVESRNDKRPIMSDLRESGAIEQDADIISFIYRDDFYNPDSEHKGTAEVIISKQRNGPTGTVTLTFFPQFTLFQDYVEKDGFETYPETTAVGNMPNSLPEDLF